MRQRKRKRAAYQGMGLSHVVEWAMRSHLRAAWGALAQNMEQAVYLVPDHWRPIANQILAEQGFGGSKA